MPSERQPSRDTDEDEKPASEPYYGLLDEILNHPRVCSNCFRDRRGNVEEDFYRTSGGSNSQLRADFCQHDGTAAPWTEEVVSELWDVDPLPARGDRSLARKLGRMVDRLDELADVEPERDAALDAALELKCDSEWAGRDRDCFAVGLEAALDDADVDLS